MVSAALARNVIGIIGNVISLGYFLTPAPIFYGMIKKKVVDKEFEDIFYVFATLNCAFWVLYGMPFVHPQSLLVVTNYSVGLLIHLIYLTIFCIYTTTDAMEHLSTTLLMETFFFARVVLEAIQHQGTAEISYVVGFVCAFTGIVPYFFRIGTMMKVIETKSVGHISFWHSMATFLNGICWTAYALIDPLDTFVLMVNSIGALFGLIELMLYAWHVDLQAKAE